MIHHRRSTGVAFVAGLAMLTAGLTAPITPAAAAAPPDPLATPAAFANPPSSVRPGFRWWWGDLTGQVPFELSTGLSELDAMAKAGFGRAEIAWGANYGDQTQRDDLRAIVDEARKLHIGIDQTLGTSWPWHTPDNTGDMEIQGLMYGRKDIAGPATFSGQVPAAVGDNSPTGKLVAVTAARVITAGPAVTKIDSPPASSTILDPASMIDLTASTSKDGTLTWHVPPGNWILFAYWQKPYHGGGTYPSNQVNPVDAASTATGLHYVAANQVGSVASSLRGVGGSFFEDSLEYSDDELYWANAFQQEFRARRGYDMTRYLPLMFVQTLTDYWVPQTEPVPDFELPGGAGARYRHDYFQTLTDLYIQDHIAPVARWARRFGMRFRSQVAYGDAFDVVRSARGIVQAGGLADDESLNAGDTPFVTPQHPAGFVDPSSPWSRFAFDHYLQITSGSHQAGGLEISSELGAWFLRDLTIGISDLRGVMDKEWAAGITRPILHGYSHSPSTIPWPGLNHFGGLVGVTWNFRTQPQWQLTRPLADYWARGALVLEQGRAPADVAVLRDSFVTTAAGPSTAPNFFFDSTTLQRAGYTLGYVDPVGVATAPLGSRGELYPRTTGYRALIVDGSESYFDQRAIPGAAAVAIDRASRRGLAVVFVGRPPSRGTGGRNRAAEDRQVRRAIRDILRRRTTRVVAAQAGVAAAVGRLGVRPAAQWLSPVAVSTQRRVSGKRSYYYVWNSTGQTVSFTGSFVAAGPPVALDLWTGQRHAVAYTRAAAGRWRVPIALGPHENTVLAFSPGNHPRSAIVSSPASDAPLDVGGWQLAVQSFGPEGVVPLPAMPLATGLQPWTMLPGLQAVSGIGTYTGTVTVPVGWTVAGRGIQLSLGSFNGIVQTYVNGVLATPEINPTAPIEIGSLVHPGPNEIKVVLATTLQNRAIGTATTSVGRPLYAAEASVGPQPYGLTGPVRLLPELERTVALGG